MLKDKVFLFKLVSRFACVLALLVVATWLNRPAGAGSRFTCIVYKDNTVTRILSCGSSAGNFIENCPVLPGGGSLPCDISPSNNDPVADAACADYEQNGCPDNSDDGGGGDGGGGGGILP